MRTRLKWLAPPEFPDEDKNRAARILNLVLWFCLISWLPSPLSLLFTKDPLIPGVIVAALGFMCVAGLIALRKGWVNEVAHTFSFLLLLITLTLQILAGGIDNSLVASFLVTVVVAGLLLGINAALIYAGFTVFCLILLYFLQTYHLLPPPLLQVSPLIALISGIVNVTLICGMIYITLASLKDTLNRLGNKEKAITESNQALQNVLASLEDQVFERTRNAETARQEAEAANQALQAQIWLSKGQSELNTRISGEQDLNTLTATIIRSLCHYLDAQIGALFLNVDESLKLVSSYAYSERKHGITKFQVGEGLVGQAALEKQPFIIDQVPAGYLSTTTGIVEITPRQICISPFLLNDQVIGVVELGKVEPFSPAHFDFIQRSMDKIAIAVNTALARSRINALLVQTQQQAEELRQREDDLTTINGELQAQARSLRAYQNRLERNQAELEIVNSNLEEKAAALQEQTVLLDRQNQELVNAQNELKQKADELALANKYKSEFLANMSHELRTPLNSLLILAHMLSENEKGNLTPDQVRSARIIYNSGNDLLSLINDILDLSRVEAGRMIFHFEPLVLSDLASVMQVQFEHVAAEKGLKFKVNLDPDLPPIIETDSQRLKQVVKNLLANAFKFTDKGHVYLNFHRPQIGPAAQPLAFDPAHAVAISVEDTGIGVPFDKQSSIFEAFQQADGSTSRKYGGSGLGLAIVREMMARLGGQVSLESQAGKGSTFTLYLPQQVQGSPTQPAGHPVILPTYQPALIGETEPSISSAQAPKPAICPTSLENRPTLPQPGQAAVDVDLPSFQTDEKVLLIIEDDQNFAQILSDYAHQKQFRCLHSKSGEAGLELAERYRPSAIILDLHLPGMSGWEVLDNLKNNPTLRHIPVHIMSVENETLEAFQRGVIGFLSKPVSMEGLASAFQQIETFISRQVKSLLVVEDDAQARHSLSTLLGGKDIEITEVDCGQVALDLLKAHHFDCMILDLNLPDMSGFELLDLLHHDEAVSKCPIIVYTGRALTQEDNQRLMKYADSVIIKGVKSPERLLDETALFLHRVVADLPKEKQQVIQKLHAVESALAGKTVLVVDDDMRNSFAISRLLGDRGIQVEMAANGQKALDLLDGLPAVDLILMDIMMPVMDGYEAIRQIRARTKFKKLPILALTAKAMKGDQEKCLEAGANDYLSKPVDPDRLISMLRVWLYK